MSNPIVIVGVGGFGREVHDIIDAINRCAQRWKLLGYLDDSPTEEDVRLVERRGSRLLGGFEWLEANAETVQYVVGIGSSAVRRAMDRRATASGAKAATLVHPQATLGSDIRIGPGSVICAGARLTTNIALGRHVHIDQNATVGHDSLLGDFVRLNPMACVSGNVTLDTASLIGANATVLQGLRVGRNATVGAGSVVTRSVLADRIVKGVPAR
ncbi:acetyltransferase [Knoellia sp. p5-6-4]|uniref:acetyltransferase n=1 Tax=unclassified Knoellia TaxID=2618719 RepID=UPI0023DCE936|nr:acetyltransferase [Knoellia sp. p5-6-4]MDF2144153.1 acetyltransferase [Knoellia sp. p5-6-4]